MFCIVCSFSCLFVVCFDFDVSFYVFVVFCIFSLSLSLHFISYLFIHLLLRCFCSFLMTVHCLLCCIFSVLYSVLFIYSSTHLFIYLYTPTPTHSRTHTDCSKAYTTREGELFIKFPWRPPCKPNYECCILLKPEKEHTYRYALR